MDLNDVYVVYNTEHEEILSVHANAQLASMKRSDYIKDALNKLRRKRHLNSDDGTMVGLRFVITTLDTAIDWMKSSLEEIEFEKASKQYDSCEC